MTIRKKRLAIASFIVVALMLVSVGFATITGSLEIKTTLTSAEQKANVVFTKAVATTITDAEDDGRNVTVSVANTTLTQGNSVTLGTENVGVFATSMTVSNLASESDVAVVTFTVQNNNNVAMKVTPDAITTTKFTVTAKFGGSDSVVIDANGTAELTVTIKLDGAAFDQGSTEEFNIKLTTTSDTGA